MDECVARRQRILLAAGLTVWSALVAVQVITPRWYPTPDATSYLSIARSMATCGSNITRLGSSNIYFGIGYPALICPVFLIDSEPFFLLSLIHAAWVAIYAAGVFRWARSFAPKAALPIAMLAIGNLIVLLNFRRTLSEAVFAGMLIWLVNAYVDLFRPGANRRRGLVAAVVLQTLLPLIRPAGILFLTGFVIQVIDAVRRREMTRGQGLRVTLVVAMPALLALATMLAHTEHHAQGDAERSWTYWNVMHGSAPIAECRACPDGLAQRLFSGLRFRAGEVCRLLIPGGLESGGRWTQVVKILIVPALAMLVLGWCRLLRFRCDAFAASLPAYVLLHVYWPCGQGGRFWVPVLPLLLLCCWFTIRRSETYGLRFLWCLVAVHMVLAVHHWRTSDRFLAERTHRHWSEMRRLSDVARKEAGALAASEDVGDSHYALEYLTDRPVPLVAADAETPAGCWLVVRREAACPRGWTPRLAAGAFKLLRPSDAPSLGNEAFASAEPHNGGGRFSQR